MIATLGAGLINRASQNSNGAKRVLSRMIRVSPCSGRPRASNAGIVLEGLLRSPWITQRERSMLLASMPVPGISFHVLSMDFPGWFNEKATDTVWSAASWPCSDESPTPSPSLIPSPTSSPLPTPLGSKIRLVAFLFSVTSVTLRDTVRGAVLGPLIWLSCLIQLIPSSS